MYGGADIPDQILMSVTVRVGLTLILNLTRTLFEVLLPIVLSYNFLTKVVCLIV